MQVRQGKLGFVLIQINQIPQIIVRKKKEQVNMLGYLIIQSDVQIMDVMYQIQVPMDIGQAHYIKMIPIMRGTSVGMAAWTTAVWLMLATASAQL